jgi:hypothetical protein
MPRKFPQYSRSAKVGDLGVSIVSRVVTDHFGWLFARTHQENDFGIDARVEVVTTDGSVTGQMIAVQIKCGMSFLQEKDQWGFVYRGEQKHFNYLANYPLPVIICLCNPETYECYWVHFRPGQTQGTSSGWRISVPFDQRLKDSKALLEAILPPAHDALGDLEQYWKFNNLVTDATILHYILDETDVRTQETELPRAFFDRLQVTKVLASHCQGRVEISFYGYDEDPRELWEIPEVRQYVRKLGHVLPDLLFFARSEQPTFTLQLFSLCHTNATWTDGRPTAGETKRVKIDTLPVADLVIRLCPALNRLTEWLELPLEKEQEIFFSAVRCMGIAPPGLAHEKG